MKLPLHIQFHGMAASEALEGNVREHVSKLEQLSADIISCRVTIDLAQKHQNQGRPISVRIDLTLPGQELVVNRVQNEDAYVALRDAFDGMKRQLDDVVCRRRAQVKQHVAASRVPLPSSGDEAQEIRHLRAKHP